MKGEHAAATVVKAHQILAKILRSAVHARVIPANPSEGIKLPKIEDEEMRFLTPTEVWALADAFDKRYRAAILLDSYAGLRAGELFGLKVGRVDRLRRQLAVVEIVTEVEGVNHVGPPKTRAGRRTVPIPSFVMTELAPHLDGRLPDDLVFPAPHGDYVHLNSWRMRFWAPAVKAAGVEPLSPHGLRHTAVAFWLAAGATPLEVARRAGHSSVVTVLNRYGHLLPADEDRIGDALEKLAARPAVKKSGDVVRLRSATPR
jgi:integrase